MMAMAGLPAFADPLNSSGLKDMLAGMGYTPNNIGTEQSPLFEVSITTPNFNIPVGFEVSASGRYVWARATLGQVNLDNDRALEALRSNGKTQPVMFWLTSSNYLVIGMYIDNRDVTTEQLRFVIDKISADVTSTAPIWNPPQ